MAKPLISLKELQERRPEQAAQLNDVLKSTIYVKRSLDLIINEYVVELNKQGVKMSKTELYRELMIRHLMSEGFLPEEYVYETEKKAE